MNKAKYLVCAFFLIAPIGVSPKPSLKFLIAAEEGDRQVIKKAIAKKTNINIRDKHGDTALMWAAQKGHVDAIGHGDFTALIAASQAGHAEIVRLLIAAKADLNRVNQAGNTALMIAAEKEHNEIVKLLTEAGAK
jgi:ankyrin repeat protein